MASRASGLRGFDSFTRFYNKKTNRNQFIPTLKYGVFLAFIDKKYYDSTPKSVPGTEILTPEDIRSATAAAPKKVQTRAERMQESRNREKESEVSADGAE